MKITLLFQVLIVLSLIGCGVFQRSEDSLSEGLSKDQGEISLKADRSHLDELRKDIPEETQKENDELALLLNMMGTVDKHPSVIRDQFERLLRKNREVHKKKTTKVRNDFNKNERIKREAFLKDLKEERNRFMSNKSSRDEVKEFYSEQDSKRKEFFADERDRRKEFESELRQKSKDFESYVREKRNEFYQMHRTYLKAYQEQQKEKRNSKKKRSEALRSVQIRSVNQLSQDPFYVQQKKSVNQVGSSKISSEDRALIEEFSLVPSGPGIVIETE